MNYSTLDRFQGAWLGSILSSVWLENADKSDYNKIIQYKFVNWIEARDLIAQIIIEKQSTELNSPQLTKILARHFSNDLSSSLKISKVDSVYRNCNVLSMLLPLILLQEDCQKLEDLYINIVSQSSFDFTDTTEARQEIAAWNYLITLVLNDKLQLEESNISMIVKQALGGVEVKAASLITKLEIVSQAWSRSWSLQRLADKLYQQDLKQKAVTTVSSAIALSLYCFISTPRNFMLSVKRAKTIRSELSAIVTVLTASISGAYNGISSMPKNWLVGVNDNPSCLQTQETAKRLFEVWLGVYNSDNLKLLYNPEINAVAIPKIFQSRKSLKIISQKSSLS